MIPQGRKAAIDFWNGAMGNAAKKLGDTEEGSQMSLLHSMTEELKDQPWYVQAAASKLIPVIQKAADNQDKPKTRAAHSGPNSLLIPLATPPPLLILSLS